MSSSASMKSSRHISMDTSTWHLCGNMLATRPIGEGQKVRRSFSFQAGEKSAFNRVYRSLVNRRLATRYRLTDYFFALSQQMSAERFDRVCRLASTTVVELMTHAANPPEEAFLKSAEFKTGLQGIAKGSYLDF